MPLGNFFRMELLNTMITTNFDISKRPLMVYDATAYLVDYKNVALHRQYVEAYYKHNELDWFDREFIKPMLNDKNYKLVLYYRRDALSYDYKLATSRAKQDNFTIYYLTKTLMTIE